jgi:hypothetical protein
MNENYFLYDVPGERLLISTNVAVGVVRGFFIKASLNESNLHGPLKIVAY